VGSLARESVVNGGSLGDMGIGSYHPRLVLTEEKKPRSLHGEEHSNLDQGKGEGLPKTPSNVTRVP
jgi:hypothetical protein